jgi:hypothetical protein
MTSYRVTCVQLLGWIIILAVSATSPSSPAETFRVDDSASLPGEAATTMRWQSLAPGKTASNLVDGATIITVRMNLEPWQNRSGKIYLVLPTLAIGQVNAEWSTQGKLLPGAIISGSRTLVFSGLIRAAFLEDTLALKIQTDGRRLRSPQRLQFHFEIDVE